MQGKKNSSMSDAQVEEAARLFGILSESSRLKLLRALMEKPLTVSELIEATGLKQGNVSKHLGVLLNARFVAREREGNFARYALADKRLYELCDLMCMRIEDDARRRVRELARS
jgi:ArsR family transcriptional regulator